MEVGIMRDVKRRWRGRKFKLWREGEGTEREGGGVREG